MSNAASFQIPTTGDNGKGYVYDEAQDNFDLTALLTLSDAPEQIRDTMGDALVQGVGVVITVDDAANTITIASALIPDAALATLI